MKKVCSWCKRKKETTLWILNYIDYKNLTLCEECSKCMEEQFEFWD